MKRTASMKTILLYRLQKLLCSALKAVYPADHPVGVVPLPASAIIIYGFETLQLGTLNSPDVD